ncbi:hypothetical protein GCM10023320_79780 [Pseudonocardia adelaidensis]|uniref:Phytase-like domain-containing protein n=1 Tax=Pseudonocardia adelaidensis TaxID=648754 RepID=A0ABP9P5W6_9PSEU
MTERLAMESVGAGAPPVRLIGEHIVPAGMQLDGTIIGGLSGIEYDDRSDRFLLVSDDRSKVNPARFYTSKITLSADGIDEVAFESVTFFRRPDGQTYPSIDEWAQVQDRYSAAEAALLGPVDSEELRVDPLTGNLAWSNEGIHAESTTGIPVLIDPALRFSASEAPSSGTCRVRKASATRTPRGLDRITGSKASHSPATANTSCPRWRTR